MVGRDVQIRKNIEEQRFWGENKWSDDGEEWSESFGGTEKLWDDVIYPKISSYLKGDVLEIASGYGRISNKLKDYSSKLYLLDMNEACVNYCKDRFKDVDHIFYILNDGLLLEGIEDNSLDFVFSWDSFVHMQKFVIETYIEEISKKLRPGGFGAIHHSDFYGGDDIYSFKNIQGRSNFSPKLLKDMCDKYDLEIVKQESFKFNELVEAFSVFRKKNIMEVSKKNILLRINCGALGDTLCSTPTVRKVFKCYGYKISVQTHRPDLFRGNPYVENIYTFNDSVEDSQFDEIFETFNRHIVTALGSGDGRNVEIKLHNFESRQFHALGVGIFLFPEEMSYDFYPDPSDKEEVNKIDKSYITLHVTSSWPGKTWSKGNWQRLVDLIKTHTDFKVVTIGRSHKENAYFGDIVKKTIAIKGVDLDFCINEEDLKYQNDDTVEKYSISDMWHTINNSFAIITVDGGPIHIAGTTDSYIIEIGASLRTEVTAPYRNGSQHYKYFRASGECHKFCASDPKYSVKEWGTINSMHYAPVCQEKYDTFLCHPTPEQVFFKICEAKEQEDTK